MRPVTFPVPTFLVPVTLKAALAALILSLSPIGQAAMAQPVQPASPQQAPPSQYSVGLQLIQVPDGQGAPIEVGVWYPTTTPATAPARGMSALPVAAGAPLAGDHLPLVVMSHGNGGWFGGHYDTAIALAKAGFVVAALTHTGDNYKDQSRATDMANRPRQLHVLIDYMLKDWNDHARLDANRVGAFGFSSGGFTVLAAAGGEPDLTRIAPHCQAHPANYDCQLIARNPPPLDAISATWTHDKRIRAVVSAAPAMGYAFSRKGLSTVTMPLQLWRAADDQILPDPDYASAVRANLPRAPDYHLVDKAGHFDFLSPCDDYTRKTVPFICQSDPAFDRVAFHKDFNAAVVGFFEANLARR
jgi:predicted dienelactone hydrolase